MNPEDIQMYASSGIRRLDYAHEVLGLIAKRSARQSEVDAAQAAQTMIEETQADLRDIEEVLESE